MHEDHPNNFVAKTKATGSMSDGSTMLSGTRHFNENETGIRANLNDVWVNEETGDRFQVRGLFVWKFGDDAPKVDRFEMRCLGR